MEAEAESAGAAPSGGAPAPTPAPRPASTAQSLVVDTPVAKPLSKRNVITRRLFILGGFFSILGLVSVGVLTESLDYLWPRKLRGFGGPISVSADRIPSAGGEPVRIFEGRFWLVNLEPGTTPNGEKTPGGVLALWTKCPHLGCTVPWNPSFNFQGRRGWFRCPCHNSTYTKEGGVIVFGPAPRPMDVFPIEVQDNGGLIVQTGRQFEFTGSPANPGRSVPLEPGNTTPPPA